MQTISRWLAIPALILAAACGGSESSTTPQAPTVTGTWTGVVGVQALSMTLTSSGSVITGSGTLSGGGNIFAETISGTFNSPIVALNLGSGLHPPFNLQGSVSGNTMTATLNGSGFAGDMIILTR